MANISEQEIKRIAEDLARLDLTDEEARFYSKKVTEALEVIAKLNEVNTDDVKATVYGTDNTNILRADEPVAAGLREAVLNNAPEHEHNQIKVPAIMD